MIEFSCTWCQGVMSVPSSLAGSSEKCPQCGTMLRVPGALPQAAAVAPVPPALPRRLPAPGPKEIVVAARLAPLVADGAAVESMAWSWGRWWGRVWGFLRRPWGVVVCCSLVAAIGFGVLWYTEWRGHGSPPRGLVAAGEPVREPVVAVPAEPITAPPFGEGLFALALGELKRRSEGRHGPVWVHMKTALCWKVADLPNDVVGVQFRGHVLSSLSVPFRGHLRVWVVTSKGEGVGSGVSTLLDIPARGSVTVSCRLIVRGDAYRAGDLIYTPVIDRGIE